MSTIKAGYRLTVTSWENDADNYRTITKDGLEESEVRFIIILLSLIKSSHHDGGCGNLFEPDKKDLEKLTEAILDLGVVVVAKLTEGFLSKEQDELPYQYHEIVNEYTGWSANYFTRVVESIKVEYVPQEIIITNVSAQFGV